MLKIISAGNSIAKIQLNKNSGGANLTKNLQIH
jgi:hypothetical protein